jgi:hypothetical protein
LLEPKYKFMDIIYNMAFSSMSTIHSMIHFNKKNVSAGFTGNVQLVGNMPQYNVNNDSYGTTLVSSNATASPPTDQPAWFSICGTSNYVVAVTYGLRNTGRNYVSSDAGNTWSGFLDPLLTTFQNNHRQAWISRDGRYRLYTYNYQGIASTTDYGANYRTINITSTDYFGAFVSTGGLVKLITVAGSNSSTRGIYKVSDNGSVISTNRRANGDYRIIKGSDDGTYILVSSSGVMVRSTDSGENFNTVSGIAANDMAVSYTGEYMIASGSGYKLWVSNNYGANWTNITGTNTLQNGLPNTTTTYTSTTTTWGACTISKTGQYMSVAGFFNQGTFQNKAYVFISSNFGLSWTSKLIISTTTDPGISTSTMSYNDDGIPIRIFIATYSNGIYYIDF